MHSTSPHYRQLQPEDRMTLASLQQQNYSIRAIARVLHRSPSTISREMIACLHQAHNKRTLRSKGQDRRGKIPDMLSIHVRPPEIEDRQFPGHWEGDLIKGEANASAVGTLVERTSRLLMLIKMPHPKPASAAIVLQAFTDKRLGVATSNHNCRQPVTNLTIYSALMPADLISWPHFSSSVF